MQTIKTICCECGALVKDGITVEGRVSHGLCKDCYDVIMAFLEQEEKYLEGEWNPVGNA